MDQVLKEYIVLFLNYFVEIFNKSDFINMSKVANDNWFVATLEVFVYAALSYALIFVFKSTIIKILRTKLESADWAIGKYLVKNNFFNRLVHLLPMLFLFNLVSNVDHVAIKEFSLKLVEMTFVILILMLVFSILNAFLNVLENHKRFKEVSMNPLFQAVKIILSLVAFIFICSVIIDQSPTKIFTALGALSAVLLLIFRETISNFVSYIQIVSFKLFKRMDWVVLKDYGADGEVVNIELNLVRVKNWDRTIVTIPTSAFTTKALINYANMSREGRRIKRDVKIDMNTVRVLSNEDIERLRKINVLSD